MTARPPTAQVRGALLQVIAEIMPDLPAADVTDDKSLKDLGADSVDRVEIISALAQRVGTDEPLSALAATANVGALIGRLSRVNGR